VAGHTLQSLAEAIASTASAGRSKIYCAGKLPDLLSGGHTTYVFLAICGVHTFGFTTRVQKFAELRHVIWRIPHDRVRPLSLTMREVQRLMVPAYGPHQVPQQSWLGYDNTLEW